MRLIDNRQIKIGSPKKLGVSIYEHGVNFAVEVPDQREVSLFLYDKKGGFVQQIPFPEKGRVGFVTSMFIEKFNYKKFEYAYCVDGKVIPDPYALLVRDGRCSFVPEEDIINEQADVRIPFENMILYKLHVRGFSKLSGKAIKKKGTFKGVEEAIPYLINLGVNAIEFMPMYEWSDSLRTKDTSIYSESVDKEGELKNYWGYASQNCYFSPKAAYASSKDPIGECRQMIQKLHEAGMECVMEFYFPKDTDPSLAVEALLYWKLYYGIDGFHLIGEGVPAEAIVRSPFFKKTKLFFDRVQEQWMTEEEKTIPKHIAEYNNDFMSCGRRFLKSDGWQIPDFISQIRKNPVKHGVVKYMANNNGFTLLDMVSYNEKHNEANDEDNRDGMPADDVWNCGEEGPTDKAYIQAFRIKQMKNAVLYTLLAQGTPLIYQGDELCNSQNGNNNAYAMDNETGWIDWKMSANEKKFHAFVKEVIAFRKAHPILHQDRALRMADYREHGYPDLSYHNEDAWYPKFDGDSRHVGCMYCGKYAKKPDGTLDDFVYVAYNTYWKDREFALPKLPDGMMWQTAIQTEAVEKTGLIIGEVLPEQKVLKVTPRTVVVLVGK